MAVVRQSEGASARSGRRSLLYFFGAKELLHCHAVSVSPYRNTVCIRSLDEGRKQGMRLQGLRLELRVELATQEEWVAGYFNNLNVGSIRRGPRNSQTAGGKGALIFAVELIAVPMAFADLGLPVRVLGERAVLQAAGP